MEIAITLYMLDLIFGAIYWAYLWCEIITRDKTNITILDVIVMLIFLPASLLVGVVECIVLLWKLFKRITSKVLFKW